MASSCVSLQKEIRKSWAFKEFEYGKDMAIAGAAAVDHGVKKKRMEAAWKAELAD